MSEKWLQLQVILCVRGGKFYRMNSYLFLIKSVLKQMSTRCLITIGYRSVNINLFLLKMQIIRSRCISRLIWKICSF